MQHRSSMASSSLGIDDFLLDYKHHQSSIQDFMSCLDGSSAASRSTDALDSFMPSEPTFHDKGSASTEVDFDSESNKKSNQDTSSHKVVCRARQSKKTIGRKQALTSEEKDERRRLQNREAQRRFRERHMLEVYRKASSNLQTRLFDGCRLLCFD